MKIYYSAVLCAILLTGCSNSSSTPDNTDGGAQDTVLTGVFLDSAVEGVSFATETQSGTTNAAGEFSYLAGEQVTFSIGAAQLPAVAAAAQVTPVDIAASSATPAAMTTNIARLLQSLDQDGIAGNGITISADAAISASQLNFDVSTAEFENNAEVINLVANSGSSTTTLIDADTANAHLNATILVAENTAFPNGAWWSEVLDEVLIINGSQLISYVEKRDEALDEPFICWVRTDGSYNAATNTLTGFGEHVTVEYTGSYAAGMTVRTNIRTTQDHESIELTGLLQTSLQRPGVTTLQSSLTADLCP